MISWLLNRRVVATLLWTVLLLAAAVAANLVGIYLLGSIDGWEHWLSDTADYFLLWRIGLYTATTYGWLWMRRRLLARESSSEARQRLVRTEIAGVAAIIALESSLLMQRI